MNADLLAATCVELRLVEAAGLLQDRSLLDPPERGIIKPVIGIFVALLAPVRDHIMRGLGHDGFIVEITRSTRLRLCSVALAARSEIHYNDGRKKQRDAACPPDDDVRLKIDNKIAVKNAKYFISKNYESTKDEKKCEDLVDLDRQPGQVRITNILRGVTVCSDTVGWTGAQIHVGDSLATQWSLFSPRVPRCVAQTPLLV